MHSSLKCAADFTVGTTAIFRTAWWCVVKLFSVFSRSCGWATLCSCHLWLICSPRWLSCRYVMWVTEQLGPVDSLVPPPPSLTRYKKELAVRAEASPKSAK